MLVQTTRREKILMYGGTKVGKSFSWLDIAETYYQSGVKDKKFYVIDSDFGIPKMLDEGYGHLQDEGILHLWNPIDFENMMQASREVRKLAGSHDWIIIDMAEQFWTEAQSFYIRGVYGDEPADYFLQMRREVTDKGGKDPRAYGGQSGTDWGFITKIYKECELPLTMKSLANVFVVTEERKLDSDRGDAPDKIKDYKHVGGMAPVGQKGLGHRLDTVFRATKRTNGQRQITLVGDRGREEVSEYVNSHAARAWAEHGKKILNLEDPPNAFTQKYLVEIAGWKHDGVGPKRKKHVDVKTTKTTKITKSPEGAKRVDAPTRRKPVKAVRRR